MSPRLLCHLLVLACCRLFLFLRRARRLSFRPRLSHNSATAGFCRLSPRRTLPSSRPRHTHSPLPRGRFCLATHLSFLGTNNHNSSPPTMSRSQVFRAPFCRRRFAAAEWSLRWPRSRSRRRRRCQRRRHHRRRSRLRPRLCPAPSVLSRGSTCHAWPPLALRRLPSGGRPRLRLRRCLPLRSRSRSRSSSHSRRRCRPCCPCRLGLRRRSRPRLRSRSRASLLLLLLPPPRPLSPRLPPVSLPPVSALPSPSERLAAPSASPSSPSFWPPRRRRTRLSFTAPFGASAPRLIVKLCTSSSARHAAARAMAMLVSSRGAPATLLWAQATSRAQSFVFVRTTSSSSIRPATRASAGLSRISSLSSASASSLRALCAACMWSLRALKSKSRTSALFAASTTSSPTFLGVPPNV